MENDTKKELEEEKKTAPVSEKKEEASSKKRDTPNKKTSVCTSLLTSWDRNMGARNKRWEAPWKGEEWENWAPV